MLKKFKIFIASSIEDLKSDRIEIGDFFRQLNEIYLDKGVHFTLIKCEDYDNAIATNGKQSQYDAEIRDSDLSFFLFFRKVGDYTKHELEIALESFKKTNKPKIVTYFKEIADSSEITDEVMSFMNMLSGELNHYYNTYGHIDSLKLGMFMQILNMHPDGTKPDISNGHICIGTNAIADTANIPMFSNNPALTTLKNQLAAAEAECSLAREKYLKTPDNDDAYAKYRKALSAKNEIETQIRKTETDTLSLAETMAQNISDGQLSPRQLKGYRLIEKGDISGALSILNLTDIVKDMEKDKATAASSAKGLFARICELRQRIAALKLCGINSEITDEIDKAYKIACDTAEEYNLDKEIIREYIMFLLMNSDYSTALKYAERLELYYKLNPPSDLSMAMFCDFLGGLYRHTENIAKSEEMQLKALNIFSDLAEKDPVKYADNFSIVCANLGTLYAHTKKFEEGEKWLKKSLDHARLCGNKANIAQRCNNLGVLYNSQNRYSEAHELLSESLEIYKQIRHTNRSVYEPEIAACYENLAIAASAMGDSESTIRLLKKSNELFRKYSNINPGKFEIMLLKSYNNLAFFYYSDKNYTQAETAFSSAIKLGERIVKENPQGVAPLLPTIYDSVARMYNDMNNTKKAVAMYKKAIEASSVLVSNNPAKFEPLLASEYVNLGNIHARSQQATLAEEMYNKAIALYEKYKDTYEENIRTIRQNMDNLKFCKNPEKAKPKNSKTPVATQKNPQKKQATAFEEEVQTAQRKELLGDSFVVRGDYKSAEVEYKKAIDIFSRIKITSLAAETTYCSCCCKMGDICLKRDDKDNAQKYFDMAFNSLQFSYSVSEEIYASTRSATQSHIATICRDNGYCSTAVRMYNLAIDFIKPFAEKSPETHEYDIASNMSDMAVAYELWGKKSESNNMFKEAVRIFEKYHTDSSRAAYSRCCKNMGRVYERRGKHKDAEKSYIKATAISKELFCKSPEKYMSLLSKDYTCLLNFYGTHKMIKDAVSAYISLAEIYGRFYPQKLSLVGVALASCYTYAANLSSSIKKNRDSRIYAEKAISILNSLGNADNDEIRQLRNLLASL